VQNQESGKTKAEIIEEEGEEEFTSAVRRAVIEQIGMSYFRRFDEHKIKQKTELDRMIRNLIAPGTGIILTGKVGSGKTMDMVYIFQKVLRYEKGSRDLLYHAENFIEQKAKYYFMPALFNRLHFGNKIPLAKYVFLDDWGREYAEPFALQRFEILIEQAYKNELKLIISTNLTQEEFINRPSWLRINDRVRERCGIFKIQGTSRRHK